jgi:hypothetical protein
LVPPRHPTHSSQLPEEQGPPCRSRGREDDQGLLRKWCYLLRAGGSRPMKPTATPSIAPGSRDHERLPAAVCPIPRQGGFPDERRDESPAHEPCPMRHQARIRGAGAGVGISKAITELIIPFPSGAIPADLDHRTDEKRSDVWDGPLMVRRRRPWSRCDADTGDGSPILRPLAW